jgi:hypothetical protein
MSWFKLAVNDGNMGWFQTGFRRQFGPILSLTTEMRGVVPELNRRIAVESPTLTNDGNEGGRTTTDARPPPGTSY